MIYYRFRDLRESAREEARKAEQNATARIPMEVQKALAAGGLDSSKGPGSGGEARAFREAPMPVDLRTRLNDIEIY